MGKTVDTPKSNENKRWDSTKPGTIVASPEAHAHEGAGTAPARPKDAPGKARPDDPRASGADRA